MKFLTIAAAGLLLAGCTSFEDIEGNLMQFNGQPLDLAIQKMGYPTTEATIAGKHVYTWLNSSSGTYVAQAPINATSMIGGQYIQTTGSMPVMQGYNFQCRVTMAVDSQNIIQHVEYGGNLGGCERYASLGMFDPSVAANHGLQVMTANEAGKCQSLGSADGHSSFYGVFASSAYRSAYKSALSAAKAKGATHVILEDGGSSESKGTNVHAVAYRCG